MDINQRNYQRFSVQVDAFAALGKDFEKIGRINDITVKGLAFTYLNERVKTGPYSDGSRVEIFLTGNGFHLYKMPCKIVYDIQHSKSKKNNSIKFHRCGLQFGKLSKIQSELLEWFLENYTTRSLL